MRASVRLFREPGYAWISDEVQAVLDKSARVLDQVDDPATLAIDLSEALLIASHVVRDYAADLIAAEAS